MLAPRFSFETATQPNTEPPNYASDIFWAVRNFFLGQSMQATSEMPEWIFNYRLEDWIADAISGVIKMAYDSNSELDAQVRAELLHDFEVLVEEWGIIADNATEKANQLQAIMVAMAPHLANSMGHASTLMGRFYNHISMDKYIDWSIKKAYTLYGSAAPENDFKMSAGAKASLRSSFTLVGVSEPLCYSQGILMVHY